MATTNAQIYEWRVYFGADISMQSAVGDRQEYMYVGEETETNKTHNTASKTDYMFHLQ